MKQVAFGTSKGGVGKTSMAYNIAAELVMRGKKVLMIDADPQANLTSGVGLNIMSDVDRNFCTASLFTEECPPLSKLIMGGGEDEDNWLGGLKDLYLIPGHPQLVFTDRKLLDGLFEAERKKAESQRTVKMYQSFLKELTDIYNKLGSTKDKNTVATLYNDIKDMAEGEISMESQKEYQVEAGALKKITEKYKDDFDKFDYVFWDLNTYMSEINLNILSEVDSLVSVTDPSLDGLLGITTFAGLYDMIIRRGDAESNMERQAIVLNKNESRPKTFKYINSILHGDFDEFEKVNIDEAGNEKSYEEMLFPNLSDCYIDCPISKSVLFVDAAYYGKPIHKLNKDTKKILLQIKNLTDKLIEEEVL